MGSGIASSLSYVNLTEAHNEKSPKLIPYPDWRTSFIKINSKNTANQTESTKQIDLVSNIATIVSTFQIRVDECNRLWVIDTGLVGGSADSAVRLAKPALVIFNLNTNEVIRRYQLNKNHYQNNSFFANVVSVRCAKTQ